MAENEEPVEFINMMDEIVYEPEEEMVQLEVEEEPDTENVEFQEVMYAEGSEQLQELDGHTLFIHEGKQYYIPNELHQNGQTIVLEEDDEDNEYVINTSQDDDNTTIEESQTEEYYEMDASEADPSEIMKDSENSEECYMIYRDESGGDSGDALGKQYAVLKDGKLHIQSNEEDQNDIHEKFQALQNSLKYDKESDVTGRNLITGQTISLSGFFEKLRKRTEFMKTHGYTEDLLAPGPKRQRTQQHRSSGELSPRPDYVLVPPVNKRVVVGRTPDGKRIIGKILQIQKKVDTSIVPKPRRRKAPQRVPETKVVKVVTPAAPSDESANVGGLEEPQQIEELIIDNTGKILHVENHTSSPRPTQAPAILDTNVLRTLSGLMDLESIQKSLINRNLLIKHVMKKSLEGRVLPGRKVLMYNGHMEQVQAIDYFDRLKTEWVFVPDVKSDDATSNMIDLNETSDSHTTEGMCGSKATFGALTDPEISDMFPQESRARNVFGKSVVVSIVVIEDEHGKKRTKVMLPQSGGPYKCQICSKLFKSDKHLSKHLAVHEEVNLTCTICHTTFYDMEQLLEHNETHWDGKTLMCSTCLRTFNNVGAYKRHMRSHFPMDQSEECPTCPEKFDNRKELHKHMNLHTGANIYQCDLCSRSFATQGELRYHRKSHTSLKRYQCDICSKEFNRHSNLLRHSEIHNVTKSAFKCDMCGCQYNFISSLTRHIVNNHMGEVARPASPTEDHQS